MTSPRYGHRYTDFRSTKAELAAAFSASHHIRFIETPSGLSLATACPRDDDDVRAELQTICETLNRQAAAPDAKPSGWEAHTGEDYAVVMLPDETTDNASIRVISDDATLPARIAGALNCHDELVVALEAAEAKLTEFDELRELEARSRDCTYRGLQALVAVRAALAKAKGSR